LGFTQPPNKQSKYGENNMKTEKALSPFLQKMKDEYLRRNQNGKD
jgi:hypothetical protein